MRSTQTTIAIGTAALVACLAVSGCAGSGGNSSSSPQASSSKPVTDYTKLLVNPADINLPGDTFTAAKPAQGFPTGAAVGFWNPDHSRVIDDRLVITPDPAAAAVAYEGGKGKLATFLPDTTMSDVPVGQGGALGVAKTKDGTKIASTVTFHEGTAFVTMEFDSPATNPLPDGFPVAVAQQQDAAIKSGLPG